MEAEKMLLNYDMFEILFKKKIIYKFRLLLLIDLNMLQP